MITLKITTEGLQELEDFIYGRGKFRILGKGIATYPNSDESKARLHSMCLELEKQGKIERHNDTGNCVVWKPIGE